MRKVKEWMEGWIYLVWNALFLDFYLDKNWTLKFKVLNFLSGDVFRVLLCGTYGNLSQVDTSDLPISARFGVKYAKKRAEEVWHYYHK